MSNIYVKSYADAVKHLAGGRDKDRRKVANNTYVERRDENTVAVKLHATDVVTFHLNGSITLNSGGWLTVTTKDRINSFTPDVIRVGSKRSTSRGPSRWVVDTWESREWVRPADADWGHFENKNHAEFVFVDGMTLTPTPEGWVSDTGSDPAQLAADDAANAALNRKITAYAKLYTDEQIDEMLKDAQEKGTTGDCWFCSMVTEDGTPLGDKNGDVEHLRDHIAEKYVMISVAVNALIYKGFDRQRAVTVLNYRMGYRVREAIREYLRARLYTEGVTIKNGRRPTDTVKPKHWANTR